MSQTDPFSNKIQNKVLSKKYHLLFRKSSKMNNSHHPNPKQQNQLGKCDAVCQTEKLAQVVRQYRFLLIVLCVFGDTVWAIGQRRNQQRHAPCSSPFHWTPSTSCSRPSHPSLQGRTKPSHSYQQQPAIESQQSSHVLLPRFRLRILTSPLRIADCSARRTASSNTI